jgi:hypothetical protein
MRTVSVYRAEALLETITFSGHFYIVRHADSNDLFWETSQQQYEATQQTQELKRQGRDVGRRGGGIQLWLRHNDISFVLPDWQLRVNGTDCERGFYLNVEIQWRMIELSYGDYWFKFLFSVDEIHSGGHAPPRPARTTRDVDA